MYEQEAKMSNDLRLNVPSRGHRAKARYCNTGTCSKKINKKFLT